MRNNGDTAGQTALMIPTTARARRALAYRLALAVLLVVAGIALAPAAQAQYSVFLGYADTLRPNPANFPTPWQGGPGVVYEACSPASSCSFDSGAIRIVNTSGTTLTVNSVTVTMSTCTFDIWPHTISLPAGGQLILAQTVNSATSGCTNNGSFDTSDLGPNGQNWAGNCSQSGVIPSIAATVNSTLTTFTDSTQILNTGGVDKASCPTPGNESQQWTPVGKAPCTGSVVSLSPSTQTDAVKGNATVTANLSCGGTPISEANVNFTVLSGPNTNVSGSGVTDVNGNASFQYTSLVAGNDTLQASAPNAVGAVYSNQVSAVWTGSPAALITTALKALGQPDLTHDITNIPDSASMFNPQGIAFDLTKAPTTIKAYVVDRNNNRVLGWSTISGLVNGTAADIVLGQPDFISVAADYNGITAQSMNSPNRVAVDGAGNVFVADFNNNRVLVFKSPGPGAGAAAFVVFGQGGDFSSAGCNLGNSSAPSPETLCNPAGIAIDKNNNVWIADYTNARVVEYNSPLVANGTPGSGTTVGQMVLGQPNLTSNTCDFNSVSAQSMCRPGDVLSDPVSGGIYVADENLQRVLFFPAPQTSTETATKIFGQGGNFTTSSCNFNGVTADSLCTPTGMALDASSNFYLVDFSNNRILEYLNPLAPPSGGCPSPGVPGCAGDTTADAVFGQAGTFTSNGCNFNNGGGPINGNDLCNPSNVAIVPSTGQLWASDAANNRTLIFNTPATSQAANLVLGQGTLSTKSPNSLDAASMGRPEFVAVDTIGNHLYVSDPDNNRVLGWKTASTVVTGQAADIVIGQADFVSGGCNPAGVTPQNLCTPAGVAVDSSGNVYVADFGNNRVLEFNTPFGAGQPIAGEAASNVWGQGGDFFTNGCNLQRGGANSGQAGADTLCNPSGIFIDSAQGLWVADQTNDRVLLYFSPLLNPAANVVFGQPNFSANYDNNTGTNTNGPPSATNLFRPNGVAVDPLGNAYIADENNNRVLEYNTPLNPSSGEAGAGSCVTASGAFSGGCTATEVFGQSGKFTTNTCNGTGNGITNLCTPTDVAIDPIGDLLVTDWNNSRVLLYRNPLANTVSNQVFGQAGDFQTNACNFTAGVSGNSASAESLCNPFGLAPDAAGNLYVADYNNRRVLFYDPPVLLPRAPYFGKVAKGTPVTKMVTFYSKSLTVDVAGVEITGINATEFQVTKDACSGKHLSPKSSCSVQVTFTPIAKGYQKAQLSLYDDAYNSPHRVTMAGSGD